MKTIQILRQPQLTATACCYCLLLLLLLLPAACAPKAPSSSDATAFGNEAEAKHETSLSLTEAQMKTVNIRLGAIEQRALTGVVRANGELTLSPQTRAAVHPLCGGLITQIPVFEGAFVKAGQPVAYLENTEIVELQKDYLTAKETLRLAVQELERQDALAAQQAGVEKTRQQAAAARDIAAAQLAGLETQMQQLSIDPGKVTAGHFQTQIPIKAPLTGTIDKIRIATGAYADIQTPLMSISDNTQMHGDLYIFEKDIHSVETGQEVNLALTNQPGKHLKGVIFGINTSFENDTKAIITHVDIHDKQGLKLFPGMYVTALINTGRQTVPAVPNDALIRQDGKQYLYLFLAETVEAGEKRTWFEPVEVITGVSEMGYTQITPLAPLPEDAQIVVSGAFYLSSMTEEEE